MDLWMLCRFSTQTSPQPHDFEMLKTSCVLQTHNLRIVLGFDILCILPALASLRTFCLALYSLLLQVWDHHLSSDPWLARRLFFCIWLKCRLSLRLCTLSGSLIAACHVELPWWTQQGVCVMLPKLSPQCEENASGSNRLSQSNVLRSILPHTSLPVQNLTYPLPVGDHVFLMLHCLNCPLRGSEVTWGGSVIQWLGNWAFNSDVACLIPRLCQVCTVCTFFKWSPKSHLVYFCTR